MTCAIPGMCSRSPNCADRRCPGHPQLHQQDGGHFFHNGVAFPIEDQQEEPLEGRPVPNVDQAEGWPGRVLVGLLLILAIAAALSPLAFI